MMSSHIRQIAYLDYCEDEFARLVGISIAHGHLTAEETRKLRVVARELLSLDCDIGAPAAMPGDTTCRASAWPSSTVH